MFDSMRPAPFSHSRHTRDSPTISHLPLTPSDPSEDHKEQDLPPFPAPDCKFQNELLLSIMKQLHSQNREVIECYQEMIHAFKIQMKEHQDISKEIQQIRTLSDEDVSRLVIERNTTMDKLNSLKLKLQEFTLSKQQYHVSQFKNILYYYQSKNHQLTDMMKSFNTQSINQFSFSKRLLLMTSSPQNQNDTQFLNHNSKIINRTQLKFPQVIVAEPPILQTLKPNFNKVRFRVNFLPGKFLYLGAVKMSVMEKDLFQFDRKVGNGAYVIAANSGYSFSNDYEEENFNPTGFRFGVDDVIDMEFDSMESQLRFSNVNKGCQTVLRVKRDQESESLHFCVIVLNEMTEVEIIADEIRGVEV